MHQWRIDGKHEFITDAYVLQQYEKYNLFNLHISVIRCMSNKSIYNLHHTYFPLIILWQLVVHRMPVSKTGDTAPHLVTMRREKYAGHWRGILTGNFRCWAAINKAINRWRYIGQSRLITRSRIARTGVISVTVIRISPDTPWKYDGCTWHLTQEQTQVSFQPKNVRRKF